jgi:multidrug efflux system membrane fusion protein
MSILYTSDSFSLRAAPWVVFVALAVSACHRQAPPAAASALVLASPVHSYSGIGAGETMHYPVEAAARYSNAMSFRVAGKLIERNVRLGDSVHKGQVVARLDPVDAQKQAASAKAALGAAEHRLVFAKQQIDRDQAQFAQNLIAANQLEQTQDAYAAALAEHEQSAAQLVVANNNLQYNTLVADHDGLITSENADTGQVLSAGQAVYGLAWTGETDVVLDAAAGDLGRITVGQAASVTFPALPGRRFEARVREVAPAADPQSRTYRVKLTLAEPGPAVRFGMTGDATLSSVETAGNARFGITGDATLSRVETAGNAAREAPVFKVPATAIFHHGKDPAVWVIRPTDSTLELRPVTVGSYSERGTTVTGGLREGDNVVLAGVHTVYAGQRVKQARPLFDGEADGEVAEPAAALNAATPINAAQAR